MVAVLEVDWKTVFMIGICASGLHAQNLLYNGSFEDCFGCPNENGAITMCRHWSIPNHSTPDIYKECDSLYFNNFDVPFNIGGHQEPYHGKSYSGIVLLHEEEDSYAEYIQGELKESLLANTLYQVTFYISWAEYSNYFCDRIGYLFSADQLMPKPKEPEPKKRKKKKRQETKEQTPLNTILPTSDGYVSLQLDTLMDRKSWHKVEFTYKAKGGEKYMVLGFFGDNASDKDNQQFKEVHTTELPNNGPSNIGKVYRKLSTIGKSAYFYIDGISLEKSDFSHR